MYANPRDQDADVVQIRGYHLQSVLDRLTTGAKQVAAREGGIAGS